MTIYDKEDDGLFKYARKYEGAGLHLVKYSKDDKCGRCCLCVEEKECRKWSQYCEEGYFMRTTGWHKSYEETR